MSVPHCLHRCFIRDRFEEFKCKNRYINFHKFEIFAIKAAEKQRKTKKICDIFHHNFKNIPCYVMSEASLKRSFSYFALLDDGLTLKTLKLAYIGFCIQTLHFHFKWMRINVSYTWHTSESGRILSSQECSIAIKHIWGNSIGFQLDCLAVTNHRHFHPRSIIQSSSCDKKARNISFMTFSTFLHIFCRVPGRRTWTHAASRKTDNVHALLVPGRRAWMIKLPQFKNHISIVNKLAWYDIWRQNLTWYEILTNKTYKMINWR